MQSGLVTRPAGTGDFYDLQSVTVNGGTLNCANLYGMRMGNQYGAGFNDGTSVPFTGSQTGGLVTIANWGTSLGSNSDSCPASYSLTGGTYSVGSAATPLNLVLGAGTGGINQTVFTLGGSATLIVSSQISGSQGTGAQQLFNFQGGTLVAGAIIAANLATTTAPTSSGTLYNTGGTLAPGGIGTAGRTVITGNYVQSGGALAIDIGGTTQASGFQTGQYDYLQVTGSATVGGALNVGLINGYVPPTGTNFTVLTAGSPVAGSFSNVASGSVLTVPGNSDLVRRLLRQRCGRRL